MGRHNVFYFAREGAFNMFSHGFMSFAAIGITVACLLIMGTFTLVAVNANAMLADLEEQNQVLAFVELGLSEKEAREMEPALRRVPNVRDVHFISDQEAAAAFRARYEDDELFQGLPDDNFSHRYAIDLVDIAYMRQTCEALDALPHIDNVNAYEDEAAGFITIRNVAGVVCVVLIAILFLVSVFIIANTIKLTTFDRRDEIAITLGIDQYERLEGIVAITEKSGVHTKFIPDYNNIIPTKPYTEDLDGLPVIHVRNVPLTNSFNKFVKRTMDIAGSLILIVLFSLPMLVVSIIVKATSEGELIFKQERIGLHGKPFMMYKFRSMAVQKASDEKKAWTTPDDPRVTPIGKFIRKTSLDELPQFFNVLKGDMSLVGPRPERPFFVDKFKEEIPRYMIKHQVRPGITGWAQINGYRGDTSIRLRIDCDLYYIENWSVMLDIKILLLTVIKGFINKNAY